MNNKFTVLVIEDEQHISDFMYSTLTSHDYRVLQAFSGKEGLSLINSQCPDIILLDLGLPDIDGHSIIKSVREWSSSPIIVVSARTNEREKVTALDMGADDYITKPFGTGELLARIRTSLRHSNRLNNDSPLFSRPYSAGGLKIDFSRRMVTVDGNSIHLTPIEYKIVAYLAQNSGKVVTHTTLMTQVWGPYAASDTNKILRVNMANIRRKIETNPADPKYIFTEVGVGYRLKEDEQG
ncbi:MAG: response regulator transcription factor [Lachnospiraceae bacterium]|nr:response regulator transcription factor [Lachnospiraceae bacterium]